MLVSHLCSNLANGFNTALTVAGIVINSISVVLSALTSLDWQSMSRKERTFANQLVKVAHVHDDAGQVVLIVDPQKLA